MINLQDISDKSLLVFMLVSPKPITHWQHMLKKISCPPTRFKSVVDLCSDWYYLWDNCLKKANEAHSVYRQPRPGHKLLIWHFYCLSSRGVRQRVSVTPQGLWVTASIGVCTTDAEAGNVKELLLLSRLETNGLFRAYFICTCGERAERKWEPLDGSALDVFN